jgi:hypothetical protein
MVKHIFQKISFCPKNEESEPPTQSQFYSVVFLIFLIFILVATSSCTLSFTNVMTSGEADDVVDTSPQTTANPNITVPVKPL